MWPAGALLWALTAMLLGSPVQGMHVVDPPPPASSRAALSFFSGQAPAPGLLPSVASLLAPAHGPLAAVLAGFKGSPGPSPSAEETMLSPQMMTYNVTNGTCYGSGLFK
jgi:hypothetical protein